MYSTTVAHLMRTSSRPCEIVLGFAVEPEPESSGSLHTDVAVAAAAPADQRVRMLSAPKPKPPADLPDHHGPCEAR